MFSYDLCSTITSFSSRLLHVQIMWRASSLSRQTAQAENIEVIDNLHFLILLLLPYLKCALLRFYSRLVSYLSPLGRTLRNPERQLYISQTVHYCRSFTLMQLIYFSISLPPCSFGSVCTQTWRWAGSGAIECGDKGTEEKKRRPTGVWLLSNYASPVSHGSEK